MRNLRFAALVLFALLVALGYQGVGSVRPDADAGTRLYLTLQLFFVEGDWTLTQPLPWQVQITRFVAPVFLVTSIALLFVRGALTALHNASGRLVRNHIIVVGLDELALAFVRNCQRAQRPVVVVCSAAQQDEIAEVRALGLRVFTGSVLDMRLLQRAGMRRASHLVAFMDDGVNVELVMRVRRALKSAGRREPLKARLHLRDTRLGERLEEYPKFFDDAGVVEVSVFNVGERTARSLLQRHPIDMYADVLGLQRVRLVLFGVNDIASNVALATARQAHFAGGERACVTVVAADADAAIAQLLAEHPLLGEALDLTAVVADLGREFLMGEIGAQQFGDVSMYVVCMEDDIRSVEFSLYLRRELLAGRALNAPIMVHTRNGGGIARLLESDEHDVEIPDGLFPFGLLSEVLTVDNVVDERVDDFARAIHAQFLASLDEHNRPTFVDWPKLPETFRRENRHQADHMDIKFRAIGMRIIRGGGRPQAAVMTSGEVELLARMEKQRWLAGRYVRSWQFGPQRRDYQRFHPLMVPWETLSEGDRAYDRAAVNALPDVVRHRLGLDVARDVRVGLCVLDDDADAFAAAHASLQALPGKYPGHVFSVIHTARLPLERRLATCARQELQALSLVLLPLPDDLYLKDLPGADAHAVRDYRRMVGQAAVYAELPLRFGSCDELGRDAAACARQCELAHAYLAQRSDELVVVGTGAQREQVARWRAGDIEPEYLFPGRFFPRADARVRMTPEAAAGD